MATLSENDLTCGGSGKSINRSNESAGLGDRVSGMLPHMGRVEGENDVIFGHPCGDQFNQASFEDRCANASCAV